MSSLIDRRNHHVFQPLLYQVATAGLSPGDIASPDPLDSATQRNVRVWLAEATAIDATRRVVKLTDGEVPYDFLIVAAGSTHAYFGHDEWRHVRAGSEDAGGCARYASQGAPRLRAGRTRA